MRTLSSRGGIWSNWNDWNSCDTSCMRSRSRQCIGSGPCSKLEVNQELEMCNRCDICELKGQICDPYANCVDGNCECADGYKGDGVTCHIVTVVALIPKIGAGFHP